MSSSSDEWCYDEDSEEGEEEEKKDVPGLNTEYTILTPSDIEKVQSSAINHITDNFGFSSEQAASLLRRYYWDVETLSLAIIDGKTSGLINLDGVVGLDGTGLCPICFSSGAAYDLRGLECGHYFCRRCYKEYLKEEISAGVRCTFAKCPMDECELLIPEDMFRELLGQKTFEIYKRYIKNSYVELNADIKWCPAPDCPNCVRYPATCKEQVFCLCGHVWCYMCGNESHRPLTCQESGLWNNQQLSADNLNNDWMKVNTKACPKCSRPIQKNQGCMRMKCYCEYQFCWLCMGPWTEHSYDRGNAWNCNNFSERRDKGEYKEMEEERSRSLMRLQKNDTYAQRFVEHKKSLVFAKKKLISLRKTVQDIKRIPEGVELDLSPLEEAGKMIVQARLAIAHSYALVSFIEGLEKLQFFEFIQSELEKSLETIDDVTDFKDNSLVKGKKLNSNIRHILYEVNRLVQILKYHFEESISAMEAGLPQVKDTGAVESAIKIKAESQWLCTLCTFMNDRSKSICDICKTAKPTTYT